MEGFGANAVREMLARHGLRISKSLGQHFLIDGNITEKMVRLSGLDSDCGVLEIGPGTGALTLKLCSAAGYVTAVELDKRLLPILDETLCRADNVGVVQGDILKLNLIELVNEYMPGYRHHVCANLPYNITSPIIAAILDTGVFETITVMVKREVAQRICAKPGSSEYGSFSIYVNYHTEAELLFDVSPECFLPKPKIWSSVIKLKTRKQHLLKPVHEKALFSVVRAAFNQRRKTLVNALHAAYGANMSKEEIRTIIEHCGFNSMTRGETLSIDSFSMISERFINQVDVDSNLL